MEKQNSKGFKLTLGGAFIFLTAGILSYGTKLLDAEEIIILCHLPAFILILHPLIQTFSEEENHEKNKR